MEAIKRFLRVAIPQLPALYLMFGADPTQPAKTTLGGILILGGACLTALDKFLRDKGIYAPSLEAKANGKTPPTQ